MAAVERGTGRHGDPSLVRGAAGEKMDRAPSVDACTRGATTVCRLRFSAPAAPGGDRLRLLPSGPDLVHGSPSRRDRTINTTSRALTSGLQPLEREFSPARADCGYRAPLAPRLARSATDPSRFARPSGHPPAISAASVSSASYVGRSHWAGVRRAAACGRVRRGGRARDRCRRGREQGGGGDARVSPISRTFPPSGSLRSPESIEASTRLRSLGPG